MKKLLFLVVLISLSNASMALDRVVCKDSEGYQSFIITPRDKDFLFEMRNGKWTDVVAMIPNRYVDFENDFGLFFSVTNFKNSDGKSLTVILQADDDFSNPPGIQLKGKILVKAGSTLSTPVVCETFHSSNDDWADDDSDWGDDWDNDDGDWGTGDEWGNF